MELKNFKLKYESTQLYFGLNSVENIRDYVKQFEKVVVVTGKTSAKASGAFNDVEKILREAGIQYVVYDNVSPNPWASQADKLADVIRVEGVDAVIAIGGGSPIDTAKVGLTVAVNGGKTVDYVRGLRRVKRTMPLIAINLTHGTGTEVDRYAVVTLDETKEKVGLAIKYPDVSIDDPRYTLTLSKSQTIYTSLDAFYHAYEAAVSRKSNMFIEMLSEEAVKIIAEVLPKLVNDLQNTVYRYKMMYASMVAGIAIDMNPAHVIHTVEHVLSGLEPRIAHASGLAMLGPRAIYYLHKAMPETSARLLKHFNPSIKPLPEYAEEAEKTVKMFQEEVGFRERLSDYGITEKNLKEIATRVLKAQQYLDEMTPFKVSEDIVLDILTKSL